MNITFNMSSSTSSSSDSSAVEEKDKQSVAATAVAGKALNALSSILPSISSYRQDEDILVASVVPLEEGLRKYDVLKGRGSGPNQSQGNTLFRQMVGDTYREYLQSLEPKGEAVVVRHPHHQGVGPDNGFRRPMDGTIKNLLARQILAKVQNHGGRFLRRICMEDYRNLPEVEKARVVRVPVDPGAVVKIPFKKSKESQDEWNCSTSNQHRVDLYVELSAKDTLEKIKQSLRFQVDRREEQERDSLQQNSPDHSIRLHSSLKVSPLNHKDRRVKKRTAMDAGLFPAAVDRMGSPQPPGKRAVPFGALDSMTTSAQGYFGLSPMHVTLAPTASSVRTLPGEITRKLLEISRLRQNPPATGLTYHGTGDFSMWHSSRLPEAGRLTRISSLKTEEAAVTLERLQQLQNQVQNQKKFPDLWNTHNGLKGHEAPTSSPPTLSGLRDAAQLEALSRRLIQEQWNAELASNMYQQHELKMATPWLEQGEKFKSLASGLSSDVNRSLLLSNPSSYVERVLLDASLHASLRQPLSMENPGGAIDALNQRATFLSGGITENLLSLLYGRASASSDGNAISFNSCIAPGSQHSQGPKR